ncbi:MAG: hypothetical protein DCC55_22115 [Chloroflexi bacterium]|nr:MAG: hypothetical protein DCC55_22115 [Chloroflexota bacterium]
MTISPQHPALKAYYEARQALSAQPATHELAVRTAFQNLLDSTRPKGWTLVMEQKVEGLKRVVRPDAMLRDSNTLPRGYWEAKDTQDDLDAEIARKLACGYPKSNIIFEDSQRAGLSTLHRGTGWLRRGRQPGDGADRGAAAAAGRGKRGSVSQTAR